MIYDWNLCKQSCEIDAYVLNRTGNSCQSKTQIIKPFTRWIKILLFISKFYIRNFFSLLFNYCYSLFVSFWVCKICCLFLFVPERVSSNNLAMSNFVWKRVISLWYNHNLNHNLSQQHLVKCNFHFSERIVFQAYSMRGRQMQSVRAPTSTNQNKTKFTIIRLIRIISFGSFCCMLYMKQMQAIELLAELPQHILDQN